LTGLLALADEFSAVYTLPGKSVRKHVLHTGRLSELFALCDGLLKKIDALALTERTSMPGFYAEYQRMRVITDSASRQWALQFTVLDEITGNPVEKAQVSARAKGGSELDKSVKVTGPSGVCYMSLDPGEYTYEVEFGGFGKQKGDFFINEGLRTDIEVKLKKNE
ncbi:MAG: carboxypeptidase-like regulatory domain-containing protein, partial [Bacteroidota bacterium]